MIAMLLIAQLSSEIGRFSPPDPVARAPAVQPYRVDPDMPGGLLRIKPKGDCPGAGRLEASLPEPTALYRHGDRPAKGLKKWADYPDPKACLVEVAP
jgi:hypothetical protein